MESVESQIGKIVLENVKIGAPKEEVPTDLNKKFNNYLLDMIHQLATDDTSEESSKTHEQKLQKP